MLRLHFHSGGGWQTASIGYTQTAGKGFSFQTKRQLFCYTSFFCSFGSSSCVWKIQTSCRLSDIVLGQDLSGGMRHLTATCWCCDCHMRRRGCVCLCALCPFRVCKKREPEQRFPLLSITCTNNSTVTYSEFRGRDCDLHEGRGRAHWGQCCYPHKQKMTVLSKFLLQYCVWLSSFQVLVRSCLTGTCPVRSTRRGTGPTAQTFKVKQVRRMVGPTSLLQLG